MDISIDFLKMHGAGNSFVFISNISGKLASLLVNTAQQSLNNESSEEIALAKFTKKVCSPHFGIGADGLVLLQAPEDENAHFKLVHYNADGTLAELCGNALRCANLYVQLEKLITAKQAKGNILFATGAGIKSTRALQAAKHNDKNDFGVEVEMLTVPIDETSGKPIFCAIKSVTIDNREYHTLSVGNPHAVCLVEDLHFSYTATAKAVQNNTQYFPEGTNVEYVQIEHPNSVKVRVVERGVGETRACGSGATAVGSLIAKLAEEKKLAAKIIDNATPSLKKKIESLLANTKQCAEDPLRISMLGGMLSLTLRANKILLSGPAVCVARGTLQPF